MREKRDRCHRPLGRASTTGLTAGILAGRLYGLVISFSDRPPADQARWLYHVVEAGEYGLALEDLAAMLAHDRIVVTDQERGDIVALARQIGMDLLVWQDACDRRCQLSD
jgi:hypothetical protein